MPSISILHHLDPVVKIEFLFAAQNLRKYNYNNAHIIDSRCQHISALWRILVRNIDS